MAEGSRLDLSLHQVGRIHVLFGTLGPPRVFNFHSPHWVTEVHQRTHKCLLNLLVLTRLLAWRPIGPGGESGVVPPVPMPNTAVKRSSAHDTGVTKPRENRPVPGPFGRHTNEVASRST